MTTIATSAAIPIQRQLGRPRTAAIRASGITPNTLEPCPIIASATSSPSSTAAPRLARALSHSGVITSAAAASSIAAGSSFGQTKKPLTIARPLRRTATTTRARVDRPSRAAVSSAQRPTIQSCCRMTPSTW